MQATVKKQTLQGKVVSDKMQKTVVVKGSRYVKHPNTILSIKSTKLMMKTMSTK